MFRMLNLHCRGHEFQDTQDDKLVFHLLPLQHVLSLNYQIPDMIPSVAHGGLVQLMQLDLTCNQLKI